MYFDKSLLISPFNFFLFVISFNHVSRLDLVLIKVYSFFLSLFSSTMYLFYYMISSWSHSSVIFLLLLGLFFFIFFSYVDSVKLSMFLLFDGVVEFFVVEYLVIIVFGYFDCCCSCICYFGCFFCCS